MKPIYMGLWNNMDPASDAVHSPLTFKERGRLPGVEMSQQAVDAEVASYFGSHAIPKESWVGWQPSVPMENIKLATHMATSRDIHAAGFFNQQAMQIRTMQPYLLGQPVREAFSQRDQFDALQKARIMAEFAGASPNQLGYNRVSYRKRRNPRQDAAQAGIQGRFW